MKVEILSPAGSIDALYAGINAGADAVYIGGSKFGARAYADNPDEDELLKAIDYVHLQDKKIYMTVNTLLKDQEIENQLYDYLLPYYKQGLDAIIVQDLGVFNFIKQNFPLFDLHASTQMAITGVNGAKLMKKMGASRVVTARELSLSEIRAIHDQVDIEIESFIHGAMCYSYSGQCLFSSIIGGRSGNRGRCAGPCRQPYQVFDNIKDQEGRCIVGNNRINTNDQQYVLSMKDMNTLSIIPEIIESGVFSLKIEGRMKSPEYAAGVVSIYRKYVDLYLNKGKENFFVDKEDSNNLADLYRRSGSITGYYEMHNSKKMISLSKPAYRTQNESFVEKIHEQYVEKKKTIQAEADLTVHINEPLKLTLRANNTEVSCNGSEVQEAKNSPLSKEKILKQISKTGDTNFILDKINIDMDENIFMPVKQINELRREAFETLENRILKNVRRESLQLSKKNFLEICSELNLGKEKEKNIIEQSDKTEIYCQINTLDQLEKVLNYKEISTIYVTCDFLSIENIKQANVQINKHNRKCFIVLPFILRTHGITYLEQLFNQIDLNLVEGFLVRNIDEINYLNEKNINNFYVDSSLYVFNKYSHCLIKQLGAELITNPFELNYGELMNVSAFDNELIVYGKIPLMISAGCINKTLRECDHKQTSITIRDRKSADFTVMNSCNFCYNIIYNNLPVSLLSNKGKVDRVAKHNIRLNFTTENQDEVKEILDKYVKVFYYSEYSDEISNYTRGHFNRGVE